MAYSLYEETQLNNPDSVDYYPDQYEYPAYYHKISEVKVNYNPDHTTKKTKKATSSINYVNERKCPIYVHQYNKIQSATYNYPSKTTAKPSLEKKNSTKSKKIPGFPTTKSVLDQLEETYWATWKPNNKDNTIAMSKKNRVHDSRVGRMKAYGDVPDNITNYLISSDYESTAVDDSDYDKANDKYETVINIHEVSDELPNSARLKTTHTQEIQTDDSVPLSSLNMEDYNDGSTNERVGTSEQVIEEKVEDKEDSNEKSSDEETAETTKKQKSKLLKHTDSFIINKKKQSEVKEHFQQPKCIRLYRKPGMSTSFIRGGSYPLKSCLKRETPPNKGNFRLGAPGSPLFVSTSSFHKKSRK